MYLSITPHSKKQHYGLRRMRREPLIFILSIYAVLMQRQILNIFSINSFYLLFYLLPAILNFAICPIHLLRRLRFIFCHFFSFSSIHSVYEHLEDKLYNLYTNVPIIPLDYSPKGITTGFERLPFLSRRVCLPSPCKQLHLALPPNTQF